ncbi:TPA: YggS family pyridoxal phosphate-dependent enzyme [Candidatus Woesearchaeota archaeon]|nr:YggS family pyridoxal phosphate-dependent enzyme [Candidatus Woesearchaeota archaeon]HII69382.1 YggS family pyridoxal phosphate-dependent enzyme [Candidatus Woesearchaeota archaeon]
MDIAQAARKIKEIVPKDITILAATKARAVAEIEKAINAGITDIGENYVQEAETKYPLLKGKARLHLIGHLQKNKAKLAVDLFDTIQTIGSLELATEVNRRAKNAGKVILVLIEINSGKEQNKDGIHPEEVLGLAKGIAAMPNLLLRGLMTMAPYSPDPENARPFFRKTKQLFDQLKSLNLPNTAIDTLSMGMSDTYRIAIEEGATMVRIGSGIFGERKII